MNIEIELAEIPDDVDHVVVHLGPIHVALERGTPELHAGEPWTDEDEQRLAEQDEPRHGGAHELHELDPELRAGNTGPDPGQPPRIADPVDGPEDDTYPQDDYVDARDRLEQVNPVRANNAAASDDVWTEPERSGDGRAPWGQSGTEREWNASRGEDGPH